MRLLSELNISQKKLILIEFTRELLKNSLGNHVSEFKTPSLMDFRRKEIKIPERQVFPITQEFYREQPKKFPVVKKRVEQIEDYEKSMIENMSDEFIPRSGKSVFTRRMPEQLVIPEPRLPPRFQYLKPSPTEHEIYLGRLNSLIRDPFVKAIECNGAGEEIIVIGNFGRRKTEIILDKGEVDEVITKFSEESKIPLHTGIYSVVYGKLVFSAVISDLLGGKFIIKKMNYNPNFR
ncbi:hypothetical protein J4407_00595 [Candidatus Pacearchaeota archaeon]|nr:hypothetical protein [Candidatus Pacearchaeota archaeon]